MAELLITQAELDQYLTTVDLAAPTNNRVFNAIQLLAPAIYNDVLYYLAIGKLTLEQLSTTPINNASVKLLIESVANVDNSVLARKNFYQKRQLEFVPAYKEFIAKMAQTSATFFYRTVQSSSRFQTVMEIDRTGIDKSKFSGLFDIKTRHDLVVAATRASAQYINVAAFASDKGFEKLFDLMNQEINAFRLIYVDSTSLRSDLAASDSILGYTLRGLYTDPYRTNIGPNVDYSLLEMVNKYDVDTEKTGVPGILASWEDNTWETVIGSNTSKEFIERFSRTSYLRFVIPSLYGTEYFDQAVIADQTARYNLITANDASVPGMFDLMYTYIVFVIGRLRAGMSPLVTAPT